MFSLVENFQKSTGDIPYLCEGEGLFEFEREGAVAQNLVTAQDPAIVEFVGLLVTRVTDDMGPLLLEARDQCIEVDTGNAQIHDRGLPRRQRRREAVEHDGGVAERTQGPFKSCAPEEVVFENQNCHG